MGSVVLLNDFLTKKGLKCAELETSAKATVPYMATTSLHEALLGGTRGRGHAWVFRAINDNDGAYVALVRHQTAL